MVAPSAMTALNIAIGAQLVVALAPPAAAATTVKEVTMLTTVSVTTTITDSADGTETTVDDSRDTPCPIETTISSPDLPTSLTTSFSKSSSSAAATSSTKTTSTSTKTTSTSTKTTSSSTKSTGAGSLPVATPSGEYLSFDVDSTKSLTDAAAVIAKSMLTPYYAYQSTINTTEEWRIGTFEGPKWWWWTAGANAGSMVNYWAITKDETYISTVTEAILAQKGEHDDFMPWQMNGNMGNDDIGFWSFASLNAVEYGFPEPPIGNPSWLQLSINAYEALKSRWNTNQCGGLRWQAFANLTGYEYVNAITNGAYMQLAARLNYLTDDDEYKQTAEDVWTWSVEHGLVNEEDWQVYDGFDTSACKIDPARREVHLYNHAVYMYAAAVMANKYPDSEWTRRANGLINSALKTNTYMSSYTSYKTTAQDGIDPAHTLSVSNTGIIWTPQCELKPQGCSHDDATHKAFLASWLAKTAIMMPAHKAQILKVLKTTATALVENKVCKNNQVVQEQQLLTVCGAPWFRGVEGVQWTPAGGNEVGDFTPQYMSALEVVLSTMIEEAPVIKPGSGS